MKPLQKFAALPARVLSQLWWLDNAMEGCWRGDGSGEAGGDSWTKAQDIGLSVVKLDRYRVVELGLDNFLTLS